MLHVYAVYEIHKVWTTLGQSIFKNRSVEKTSITAFSDCVLYNHEYTISNKCSNLLLQEHMVWPPICRARGTIFFVTVCINAYPVFVPKRRV